MHFGTISSERIHPFHPTVVLFFVVNYSRSQRIGLTEYVHRSVMKTVIPNGAELNLAR